MRRIASVWAMALLTAVAGCGTVANLTLSPVSSTDSDASTATPFGGVANDLASLSHVRYRVGGNPSDYGPGFPCGLLANVACDALLMTCYVVDLPISLVADGVTLPLVLAGAFDKEPVAERLPGSPGSSPPPSDP